MRKHFAFLLSALIIVASCSYAAHASASIVPEAPLSAQWAPNAVRISFNSNDGGTPPGDQIYTYGIERSLPGKGEMLKAGYHFVGWAETATAASPTWYAGDISTTAFGYADATKAIAKTLYAVWEPDDTADASKILSGYTAHVNDEKVSGAMPSNASFTKYLNAGESYTLNPGYYPGGTILGNTLASQTSATATAADILFGKTAWVNGNQLTGSLIEKQNNVVIVYPCSTWVVEIKGSEQTYNRPGISASKPVETDLLGNIYFQQQGYSYWATATAKKNISVMTIYKKYGQSEHASYEGVTSYSSGSSVSLWGRTSSYSSADCVINIVYARS